MADNDLFIDLFEAASIEDDDKRKQKASEILDRYSSYLENLDYNNQRELFQMAPIALSIASLIKSLDPEDIPSYMDRYEEITNKHAGKLKS